MKFLGVPGVFDYAGLNRSSRYRACSCCLPHITRASASGLSVYGAEYPPRLSPVYASLSTSRYPAQDSRPSGSLLLSRKELSSSASCRFIPAHCKRLHDSKQRLARWLLMTQDRVDSGSLLITHDFLATMLGTDRTSVSLAAGVLQKKKLIEYTRGAVEIVNRKKLENSACECYGVIRQYDGELGLKYQK